jgi:hypothetical protein
MTGARGKSNCYLSPPARVAGAPRSIKARCRPTLQWAAALRANRQAPFEATPAESVQRALQSYLKCFCRVAPLNIKNAGSARSIVAGGLNSNSLLRAQIGSGGSAFCSKYIERKRLMGGVFHVNRRQFQMRRPGAAPGATRSISGSSGLMRMHAAK